MFKLLTLVFILSLSGCSLIKVPEQKRYSSNDELEIDYCIDNYNKGPIYCYRTLGELYAVKSSFYAQGNPIYYGTRAFTGVGADLLFQTSSPSEWPVGIIFLVLTPFTFVGETIYYPVQVFEHLNVPDENVEKALFYLKKARENGYTDEYMDFLPTFVRVKNLDK